jgi:hypothetical protein
MRQSFQVEALKYTRDLEYSKNVRFHISRWRRGGIAAPLTYEVHHQEMQGILVQALAMTGGASAGNGLTVRDDLSGITSFEELPRG